MKPLIIGRDELDPSCLGSPGWRLWRLLCARRAVARDEYTDAFEHRQIHTSLRKARGEIADLTWSGALYERQVLLLGRDVAAAFGLQDNLIHPTELYGTIYRQIPRPSGHSRWYNNPVNAAMVSMVLEELYNDRRTIERGPGSYRSS